MQSADLHIVRPFCRKVAPTTTLCAQGVVLPDIIPIDLMLLRQRKHIPMLWFSILRVISKWRNVVDSRSKAVLDGILKLLKSVQHYKILLTRLSILLSTAWVLCLPPPDN